MLKFRPIAPKPTAVGNLTGELPNSSNGARAGGRGKRKWGGREGRRGRKARKGSGKASGAFQEEEEKKKEQNSEVVTLPLMPETPERKEASPSLVPSPTASDLAVSPDLQQPVWQRPGKGHVEAAVVVAPRPVGSWVTMECLTDTWREGEVGGGSDEEVRRGMERDGCPGFLSDELDRVTWTNAAYRSMVVGPTVEDEEKGLTVALVTRGLVPGGVTCRAFTCRVRVRYACRRRGRVSMAVPCDVWRLVDGGLAWRLDVKAALSLSLGS